MRSFILILLCLLPVAVSCQEVLWEETIGGSDYEWLEHSFQNSRGNYVFSGYSYSDISGDKTSDSKGEGDMWIFETTPNGKMIWQKIFGGSWQDMIHKTIELPDGTYLLAGTSYSNISGDKNKNARGDRDLWILKLDANKEIEWQQTYGGSVAEDLTDVVYTSDGGYLISSETKSPASGDKTAASLGGVDIWMLKLDSSGEIEWQKTYGGAGHDFGARMTETPEGNFFVAASSSSGISKNKTDISRGLADFWLFEIDPGGEILWQKTIGGDNGDTFSDFEVTPNGGYVLTGGSASRISGEKTIGSRGFDDVWVVKVDDKGNIEWQNAYGGDNTDSPIDISRSVDSGYWIGGLSGSDKGFDKSEPHIGKLDFWMFKITEDGEKCWDKTLGGIDNEQARTGFSDSAGNYIMGGWTNSGASGDKTEASKGEYDIYITKLKAPEIVPPVVNTPNPYIACDHNGDGFAEFDLSSLKNDIIDGQEDLLLEYFTEDWKSLPSPMPAKFTNTTPNGQTINVRITRKNMGCAVTGIQVVLVSDNCDGEGSGEGNEPTEPKDEEGVIYFPSFFSPNGDGYNDTWSAFSQYKGQLQYVRVYDRYGSLVANLTPEILWNGEFNGRPLPNDDYWYHALTVKNKIITGHFSLIR